MDGIMWALRKMSTRQKQRTYFAVMFAWPKLSKNYRAFTPMMGLLQIPAHIVDPFWKLWLFRKWDKGIDIHPEDTTSHNTQYQEAFLTYVENKYCAKHRHFPIIEPGRVASNNLFYSTMASGSGQSSFDQYELPSDHEEYLTPENVAKMTHGRSNRAALL